MQFGQVWDAAKPDGAPLNLDMTIEELKRRGADIVLLQEVEHVEPEKGQIKPPPNYSKLRKALPQYDGFFSYPKYSERELPFGFGLAILSKTPIFDTEAIDLPAPQVEFKLDLPEPLIEFKLNHSTVSPTGRLLIGAKTSIGGKNLQIYNTHLQAFFMINRSSDDFPGQREIVAEHLRNSKLPTILGGDLNVVPEEATVDFLESAGYRTAQRELSTWKRQPYVLDHVFFNEALTMSSCTVHETVASDHDVLEVELTV